MAKSLHIFRAGSWVSMSGAEVSLTADDVQATADAYDPSVREAPLVLGHPKTDDPALGWVAGLSARDGELFAVTKDVSPRLTDLVATGSYRKISSAFIPPSSKSNPTPGVWYLRHVGFLGAAIPAVHGMRDAELAAGVDGDDVVAFAEQRTGASALQAKVDAERDALLFVQSMLREGRVAPFEAPLLTAMLSAVSEDVTIEFSDQLGEGRRVDLVSGFKEFLQQRPPIIPGGELAGRPLRPAQGLEIPPGSTLDPTGEERRCAALAYASAHGVDYRTALLRLG